MKQNTQELSARQQNDLDFLIKHVTALNKHFILGYFDATVNIQQFSIKMQEMFDWGHRAIMNNNYAPETPAESAPKMDSKIVLM